jgi:hypothetical protein
VPLRVLLTLTLILIPSLWLAVAALVVAACRSASLADRRAVRARLEARQKGRPEDGPPVMPAGQSGRSYGLAVSQGV